MSGQMINKASDLEWFRTVLKAAKERVEATPIENQSSWYRETHSEAGE
jgi:hypothetical protein